MKITTWNVNGIRAWLKKDSWDWVSDFKPDIFGLQEIKARPDQLTEEQHQTFAEYAAQWNPAERPGYSGTATFYNADTMTSRNGFDQPEFDVEGRLTQTHFDDIVLFNCYFPNGSRDHKRVPYKLDFYARLLDLVNELHASGKQVIIMGDFNTAHQEIDLKNPKSNKKTTGFLPEEREWVTKYVDNGLVDAFRVLYPEKEQYSWWTYRAGARERNVGWRLDYFMVSAGLMERVEDVVIHDDVMGSDHCPVTLILK